MGVVDMAFALALEGQSMMRASSANAMPVGSLHLALVHVISTLGLHFAPLATSRLMANNAPAAHHVLAAHAVHIRRKQIIAAHAL